MPHSTFNESTFREKALSFTRLLLMELEEFGLSQEFTEIDHLCFRCHTMEVYEATKSQLSTLGILISEAYVNGRPIACYKLFTPLPVSESLQISVIEVPAPKEGHDYENGFEHLEVVTRGNLSELLSRHEQVPFNLSNLHSNTNPEALLSVKSGTVKFHEVSLEQIIEQEQAKLKMCDRSHLVFLDIDDTLFSSKKAFVNAFYRALELHTGKPWDLPDVEARMRPTFPDYCAEFGITALDDIKRFLKQFQQAWDEQEQEVPAALGITSLLSCLVHEGFEIHAWTARDKVTTASMLRKAHLLQFFTGIHAFDGETRGKPQPDAQIKDLVAQAKTAILLGDSSADFEGAGELGIPFLQAAWIHHAPIGAPSNVLCYAPLEALTRIISNRNEVTK
jgi:predicted metalloenzyme YecM/phosphoglycolate phosphatase-like HAD superfamily hydrolase